MATTSVSSTHVFDLPAFHVLVLRVIEASVHTSINGVVSLDDMAAAINTNPLVLLLRKQMEEANPGLDASSPITKREVILTITRLFQSSEIEILGEGSPEFKLKISRSTFNKLIEKVYLKYKESVTADIRKDEDQFKKKLAEIALIEKGELDNVIIAEFNEKTATPPLNTTQSSKIEPADKPSTPSQKSIPLQPVNHKKPTPSTSQQSPVASVNNTSQTIPDTQETISVPATAQEVPSSSQTQPSLRIPLTTAVQSPEPTKDSATTQSLDTATAVTSEPVKESTGMETLKPEAPELPADKDKNAVSATKPSSEKVDDEDERTESDQSDDKDEEMVDAHEVQPSSPDEKEDSRKRNSRDSDAELEASTDMPQKKKLRASTSVTPSAVTSTPNKRLQHMANPLIAQISSYKYASTFLQPVNESSAPDYYKLIKEPRDLKTIKQMIKLGKIQTSEQLERDILLMFANAVMYNRTDTDVYGWARDMQLATDDMIKVFREADEAN
ncbi:CYFA0S24e01156g1_1 [Cyberlindnera fabianii]|uniref:CYFA0S24e01156g1_1 n=1 Tax=Cyberlindnera fabianii TaxID=36022 RepID=A0A061BBB0_CYBFA|nr:CYFA0S24e01156g1_1 [Cyberlindnera fabianii]